jgi:hypothetical protein
MTWDKTIWKAYHLVQFNGCVVKYSWNYPVKHLSACSSVTLSSSFYYTIKLITQKRNKKNTPRSNYKAPCSSCCITWPFASNLGDTLPELARCTRNGTLKQERPSKINTSIAHRWLTLRMEKPPAIHTRDREREDRERGERQRAYPQRYKYTVECL